MFTEIQSATLGRAVLSPDGRKIGYARHAKGTQGNPGPVIGWAVYDTTTGEAVRLEDPDAPKIEGTDGFEIVFTGDSRYLATNYSRTLPATSTSDQFVVWDVETGTRIPVEAPGRFWDPNMGSAPEGVVWSRGQTVFSFHPVTRSTTSLKLEHDVVQAAYGPDGRACAYFASTGRGAGMPGPRRLQV